MKLNKTEQLILDVMAGARPFRDMCYKSSFHRPDGARRTQRAHKAIQALKDKGVIYKSEDDHMLYVV